MTRLLAALGLTLLAACGGPTMRLDVATADSDLRLAAPFRSAIVRTVQLPTYAAAEEIAVETAPGVITQSDDLLWGDAPDRAMTLAVARQLDDILSATVGPDPWPFAGLPDVAVDIRVSDMIAGADGVFRLDGQFYTGGDGIDWPNASESFAIAVPLAGTEPGAIAAAQAAAVRELSERIARQLGR